MRYLVKVRYKLLCLLLLSSPHPLWRPDPTASRRLLQHLLRRTHLLPLHHLRRLHLLTLRCALVPFLSPLQRLIQRFLLTVLAVLAVLAIVRFLAFGVKTFLKHSTVILTLLVLAFALLLLRFRFLPDRIQVVHLIVSARLQGFNHIFVDYCVLSSILNQKVVTNFDLV